MKLLDSMVYNEMLYLLMLDRGQYVGLKCVLDAGPSFSEDYLYDQCTRVGSLIFGIFEVSIKNPKSWKENIVESTKQIDQQLYLPNTK